MLQISLEKIGNTASNVRINSLCSSSLSHADISLPSVIA